MQETGRIARSNDYIFPIFERLTRVFLLIEHNKKGFYPVFTSCCEKDRERTSAGMKAIVGLGREAVSSTSTRPCVGFVMETVLNL